MANSFRKNRWKSVVKSVLKQEKIRVNHGNLEEWKHFSESQIDLLIHLKKEDVSFSCLLEKHHLSESLQQGSQSYILHCLYATFEENQDNILQDKFSHLLQLVLESLVNGKIKCVSKEILHKHLLFYIIEKENPKVLQKFLSIINKKEDHTEVTVINIDNETGDHLHNNNDTSQTNRDALMKACEKNNYALVKLLVSAGYRYKCFVVTLEIRENCIKLQPTS
jgi:hypothetical protein